jgi:fluoride ion exporter CrcB/FEX
MRPHTTLTPRQFTFALLAVAGGGAYGTILRDVLLKFDRPPVFVGWVAYAPLQNSSVPPIQTMQDWTNYIPWVLLAINVVGVFIVTRLLRGPLRGHDPNDPVRLLVVTGFFGGLTSYSGLFVDFDLLWHRSIGGCLLVAAMAILSGVLAAELGLKRWPR